MSSAIRPTALAAIPPGEARRFAGEQLRSRAAAGSPRGPGTAAPRTQAWPPGVAGRFFSVQRGEPDRGGRHRECPCRRPAPRPAAVRARQAIAATAAMVAATCTPPMPKIARRSAHRRCAVELQADEEQQQHHAELGELQHGLRIRDQPQAPRPDRHAGDEIAEHRAQARGARNSGTAITPAAR